MKTSDATPQSYLTTREACDRLGYSRPDSLMRAWRARRLPIYRRPGGHYLLSWDDVRRFVQRVSTTDSVTSQSDG
jgi:excisionase family DNA binding protein